MTIREAIFTALTTDAALITDGINVDSVWNIEAVDNPDRRKPFLVTAWANAPRTYGSVSRRRELLVWAHDDGADYTRIDRVLERVRILLVAIVHQGGISQVEYTGASPDLYDNGFHTITRNYGFRVIGAG